MASGTGFDRLSLSAGSVALTLSLSKGDCIALKDQWS